MATQSICQLSHLKQVSHNAASDIGLTLMAAGSDQVHNICKRAPPELHAAPGSNKQDINIRDAFVASSGCLLIAADYSQIELRVLAHLSGDIKLIEILRQAGVGVDAFVLIAKTWLRKPHDTGQTYLGFFAFHFTLLVLQ